jgi:hypothetical protein
MLPGEVSKADFTGQGMLPGEVSKLNAEKLPGEI